LTAFSVRPGRIVEFTLFAVLSLAALAASARVGLVPANIDKGVAVIFAPWTSPQTSIERATADGSRFVRFGGLGSVAVVMPQSDGYADRMLEGGAWFVVDPKVLAACSAALSFARPR
jgi:hypothetical protein